MLALVNIVGINVNMKTVIDVKVYWKLLALRQDRQEHGQGEFVYQEDKVKKIVMTLMVGTYWLHMKFMMFSSQGWKYKKINLEDLRIPKESPVKEKLNTRVSVMV